MATVQQQLFIRKRELEEVARDLDAEGRLDLRQRSRTEQAVGSLDGASNTAWACTPGASQPLQATTGGMPAFPTKAPGASAAQQGWQLAADTLDWLGLAATHQEVLHSSSDASSSTGWGPQPSAVRTYQTRLHELLTEPSTSRLALVWSVSMVLVILLSTTSFVLSTVGSLDDVAGQTFDRIEMACVIVFTIDYVARLVTCPYSRLKFAVQPLNIIDVVSIVPWYISAIIKDDSARTTSVFRVLRLLRVFRLFRIGGRQGAVAVVVGTMKGSLDVLLLVVFFLGLQLVLFAALMNILERGDYDETLGYYVRPAEYIFLTDDHGNSVPQPSPFTSIPQGFWWVIVTVLTVGYGDVVPVTPAGKVVAMFAMCMGVIAMALPIGVLGTAFTANWLEYKASELQQKLRPPSQKDPPAGLQELIDRLSSHAISLEDLVKLYGVVEKDTDELRSQLHAKLLAWRQATAHNPTPLYDPDITDVQELQPSLQASGKQGRRKSLKSWANYIDEGGKSSHLLPKQSLIRVPSHLLSRENSTQMLHEMVSEVAAHRASLAMASQQAPPTLPQPQQQQQVLLGLQQENQGGTLEAPQQCQQDSIGLQQQYQLGPLQQYQLGPVGPHNQYGSQHQTQQQYAGQHQPQLPPSLQALGLGDAARPQQALASIQAGQGDGPQMSPYAPQAEAAVLPLQLIDDEDDNSLLADHKLSEIVLPIGKPIGEGKEELPEEPGTQGWSIPTGGIDRDNPQPSGPDSVSHPLNNIQGNSLVTGPQGTSSPFHNVHGNGWAAWPVDAPQPQVHSWAAESKDVVGDLGINGQHTGSFPDAVMLQRIEQLLGQHGTKTPVDRELQAIIQLEGQLNSAMAHLRDLLKVTGLLRGHDFPEQIKGMRLELSHLATMQQKTQDIHTALSEAEEDLAHVEAAAADLQQRITLNTQPVNIGTPTCNSSRHATQLHDISIHQGSQSTAHQREAMMRNIKASSSKWKLLAQVFSRSQRSGRIVPEASFAAGGKSSSGQPRKQSVATESKSNSHNSGYAGRQG